MSSFEGAKENIEREVNGLIQPIVAMFTVGDTPLDCQYFCALIHSQTSGSILFREHLAIGAIGWKTNDNMEPLWFGREAQISYQLITRRKIRPDETSRLLNMAVRRAVRWTAKCYKTLYISKGGFTLQSK